jgi:hypothetical protein
MLIVLTGGPGGGKTALIQELLRDPAWQGWVVALPEAIGVAGQVGVEQIEDAIRSDRLLERVWRNRCGKQGSYPSAARRD